MDINKHRYFMTQVLLAVFRDKELSSLLAFKGGTSLICNVSNSSKFG